MGSVPTAWQIHGFNTSDGGRKSLGDTTPYLTYAGWWPQRFCWGWTFTFRLALRTKTAAEALAELIQPGDLLVCHSHGYQVAQQALELNPVRVQMLAYNPAARRDSVPHPSVARAVIAYAPDDTALWWGAGWRKATRMAPWRWRNPHPWGRLGRYGPDYRDPRVKALPLPEGAGHSGPQAKPGLVLEATKSGALRPPA